MARASDVDLPGATVGSGQGDGDPSAAPGPSAALTRRTLLSGGAAVGFALAAEPALRASESSSDGNDLVHINKTYRALIRRPGDSGPARIESVKLAPFGGRQVLVRVTAVQCCYTDARGVLGGTASGGAAFGNQPHILGHQAVGEVEAIGPQVTSFSPGDKVYVAVTAQCGRCYNCVRGRADACYSNRLPSPIVGTLMDGTPIAQDEGGGGIGGLSEYTVTMRNDSCQSSVKSALRSCRC